MKKTLFTIITAILLSASASASNGIFDKYLPYSKPQEKSLIADWSKIRLDTIYPEVDSLALNAPINVDSIIARADREFYQLPNAFYGTPVIFDGFKFFDLNDPLEPAADTDFEPAFRWLNDFNKSYDDLLRSRQRFMIDNPDAVKYNQAMLPEPPKHYRAFIDPTTTKITFEDLSLTKDELTKDVDANLKPKHWLTNFDGSLQFSQAFISPNWYQGGNNSLNLIAHLLYHVKLNEKYHPKVLFEATAQYKLAMNTAPEDTVRSINISEDLFQVNATLGLKAAKRWFYSTNLTFKTQLFNSYPSNSRQLKSALLSPGELNLGVGMTYNYANEKKTFVFGMTLAPLSWNMKTCINDKIDATIFGIKKGHHVTNEFGSNAECNLTWKWAYNIAYTMHFFVFTDYSYLQSDWEHTITFDINRFLSTKLYAHLRYDSSMPEIPGWKRLQFKEILSFGFSYKFNSI